MSVLLSLTERRTSTLCMNMFVYYTAQHNALLASGDPACLKSGSCAVRVGREQASQGVVQSQPTVVKAIAVVSHKNCTHLKKYMFVLPHRTCVRQEFY